MCKLSHFQIRIQQDLVMANMWCSLLIIFRVAPRTVRVKECKQNASYKFISATKFSGPTWVYYIIKMEMPLLYEVAHLVHILRISTTCKLALYSVPSLMRQPKGRRQVGVSWTAELHSEELFKLYSSPNIIRVTRWMRWVGMKHAWGEMKNAHKTWREETTWEI